MDERIKMIPEHRAVVEHSEELRKQCCSAGVVQCPECEEDVAWGSLLPHTVRIQSKEKTDLIVHH